VEKYETFRGYAAAVAGAVHFVPAVLLEIGCCEWVFEKLFFGKHRVVEIAK
jgi:hypothetical protein